MRGASAGAGQTAGAGRRDPWAPPAPLAGAEVRDRYGEELQARTGWRPEGGFHLFAVDVVEVGYFAVRGGGHDVRTWSAP